MYKKLTASIADDSIFSRKLIKDIATELDITILEEYKSGDDMIEDLLKESSMHPELIFLDINMPGRSGKESLDILLDLNPEFIIIMISSVDDTKTIKECLEIGAANYIHKNSKKDIIKEIILSTIKNNSLISV